MRIKKYDRIALYNRICGQTGIKQSRRTGGYFTKSQMRDLSLYIEAMQKKIDEILSSAEAKQ